MVLHRASWVAAVALLAGCSGEPSGGGEQPYGAGTSATAEMTPQAGDGAAGSGGAGGMPGGGGSGGELSAGQGGGEELPACEESSQPALIGACVTLPAPSAGEHVNMTGVVEGIDPTFPPSCRDRALGFMSEADSKDVQVIRIGNGDGTVSLSVQLPSYLPWSKTLFSPGDKVSVDYKAELPLDSVGHGVLTVRDESGALVLWVVQAAQGFGSVSIPELTISDELHACSGRVPCGTSTRGGVLAFDGTSETSIDYASWGSLGDLVVLLGDNTKVTVDETCSGTRSFHRVVLVAMRGGGIPPD